MRKSIEGRKNKMLAMCTTNVNFHVFHIELIFFFKKGNYWKQKNLHYNVQTLQKSDKKKFNVK